MKLATIGVGSAGSRVVNRIIDAEHRTGRDLTHGNVLLINSRVPEFDATDHVPSDRQVLIGDVYQELDGNGVGEDVELAADVAREEQHEINRALDVIELHEVDGILLVGGLAGATGGGAGAVVLEQLQTICDDPVYAVGILPSVSEGEEAAMRASRSLQSYVEYAENVILFDNDAWGGEEIERETDAETDLGSYQQPNQVLVERLVTLFGAGEFSNGVPSENRLDPSDVIRTLEIGGISSIGLASTEVQPASRIRRFLRSWRKWLPGSAEAGDGDERSEPTDAAKINQLVKRAARSQLTLPCSIQSADRALIVLSGPSHALSRRGFESGRYWLEGEADIVEVLAGDEPHEQSSMLTATVLFANVTDVPRIEAMHELAVESPSAPKAGMEFGPTNPS